MTTPGEPAAAAAGPAPEPEQVEEPLAPQSTPGDEEPADEEHDDEAAFDGDGEPEADEEDDEPEETPGFAPVVRPRVTVHWPAGIAAPLHELPREALHQPMSALHSLAEVLGTMFPDTGAGSLLPDGVRWSPEHGWQLLVTPPYDTAGLLYAGIGSFDEMSLQVGWRRDQQSLAVALTHAAFGRRPADPGEIRRLADVAAGELPAGFDAVVNLLLREHARAGDTGPLRSLAETLGRRPAGPVAARCYVETGVGSKKARGRGELDNEDVTMSSVTADGYLRLGLFDGATGDGDGSGRLAATSARDRIGAAWPAGTAPAKLLHEADTAVIAATHGCTTSVLVGVERSGRAELASVGDSSAWLLRRTRGDAFHAWRLTPSHTVFAAALRAAHGARGGYSQLTHYLGGAANEPFTAEFAVCPDDLLVLTSDGATVQRARNEWFGDVLCQLAAEHARDDRPLGAAIAADLVTRAEQHGGFDNATALVAEFKSK
ncbi:SpoIIE family protein phosphatase [Dactylosporangium sp. AC04546]|uniref:SpoIIE family protein phosphatase n=1 Tax=Dactylosporangium sp. AC04546 TaxID=2862460 RepID=UPI001EDFF48E|nr:SpoIIE family protein phosphatase [Dactylosporangium sp. AC04546]WVK86396.1 SpoIIE family protein phosphatase [Dactylosporangium sp. AC04546]